MNYRFQNLLGAPYRGGNAVVTKNTRLISPVGNRIADTDLLKSQSATLPFQCSSDVSRLAVSPDGAFLLVVDENRRALFVNLPRRAVLHRITFKHPVGALEFSPDGRLIAVGAGKLVQIWRSPGFRKEFFPFELVRTFADCNDKVMSLKWSPDSSYLLVGSKDLTARVNRAYTIARDSYLFSWGYSGDVENTGGGEEPPAPGTPERSNERALEVNVKKRKELDDEEDGGVEDGECLLHRGKWELLRKDGFMQQQARVTSCDYHRGLNLLVVGFSNGVFGLYQMPDFVCIHLLSISKEKITTAVFNELGNWLTFGCAKLGQCVWTVSSGFCFVTFSEHTNAITALHFMANNHCLLSASLDGTVRAWDLFRYRNFRTFTTPSSRQFVSLTADQSSEVICAGTLDSFEIFVWSMKTGRLLDILSGHEGPVHGLMFSPTSAVLASSSWDKTVRLWDVFESKGAVETFPHTHDVLTVVYRPDGKQLACSTLDGQIHFWDPIDGLLMYTIEGRRDIAGGRLATDRRAAANSSSGKYFTTLCYSLMGVLLRRFQITHNLSLDGVLDFLNSKKMTDAGPLDLIDDDDTDTEEGVDKQTRGKLGYDLPGSMPNRGRPIIRTKCLRIAPTGRSFAAATTEGVLVYSTDETFIFDPTDLDIDVTPEAIDAALSEGLIKRALILSLRLNEDSLIKKCVFAASPADIPALASSIPSRYLQRLIDAFAGLLENCPHLEFILRWCQEICKAHGQSIQQNSRTLLPALKSLQKAITRMHQDLADTCASNEYMLRYLCSAGTRQKGSP
ncbi:hypothetical protein EUGRSUZ_J03040 [Eucalyptus grandis]|uniref:Uncharacterized protein n=2 Tax=Eucalyptus grandis TaxID=71139 RepID=A0ACC3JAV4_EUCGR|nr:hypothetical protein EUGRSUZ_J03040 [Eucalyptus grandis]